MPHNHSKSQIFSFFTPSRDGTLRFQSVHVESDDDFDIFIAASLSSKVLTDLDDYLSLGIEELKDKLLSSNAPILDRMKDAIYKAGDALAAELIESHQPVEDVDFSAGVLAFHDDVLYVWIDGDLNARIYRADDSILVNPEKSPQFFGSTIVQLGDIIGVSFNMYVAEKDSAFEDYVLEKNTPEYPVLYLDYQVDGQNAISSFDEEVEVPNEEISHTQNTIGAHLDEENGETLLNNTAEAEDTMISMPELGQIKYQGKERRNYNRPETKEKILGVLRSLSNIWLKISSPVPDFFYTVILRKNSHQLKRFKESRQKKLFQFALLFLLITFVGYILFVSFNASNSKVKTSNTSAGNKTDTKVRTDIQDQFDKLVRSYNNVEISDFNTNFTNLKSLISTAKQNGFGDTGFLDNTLNQAQNYEDTLYKVTPITKVDDIFLSDKLSNPLIVDFDVVGNDVYALDRQNSQVLKSTINQQFEIFAGDPQFKKLSRISCIDGSCYLLDEEQGLLVLSLANKKITAYKGLSSAGKDVKEMVYAFDNIYTIVTTESKLLKYGKVGDGFKAPVKWNITEGFGLDALDFAIDGNVFELTDKGELKKYYNGRYDPSFKGLDDPIPALGTNLQLAMTPARQTGINRVYISDSTNKRIAVFEKDPNPNGKYTFKGNYKYRGPDEIKFENFEEIVLSKDEKYLYVLENNSVYKIGVTAI